MKKKEKFDFLNAIKAGHFGVITGNPAHALDDKTMNAIIHNYVATIVPGKQVTAKKLLSQSVVRGLCQSVFQLKKSMSLKFIQSYSEQR
ncbi:hypothetical protein ACFH3R_003879 [Escherichia coli]